MGARILTNSDAIIALSHALQNHSDILDHMVVTLNFNIIIRALTDIFKGFQLTRPNFNRRRTAHSINSSLSNNNNSNQSSSSNSVPNNVSHCTNNPTTSTTHITCRYCGVKVIMLTTVLGCLIEFT